MTTRPHITLVELQRRIKMTLSEQFALPVWVSAEVADLKVNYSGHCYLELIEKDHKSENGVPTAQVRAVIWRSSYSRIAAYFEAETGQRLAPGIRILAQVLISYHELYGLSLQITDIDSAYTLGEMEQQRQKTIARLQEEGVWEMNRAVPMPLLVQRLAVVSSAQAAGYQDFCKELGRSGYRFDLILFDAVMQGTAAEESILMALGRVAERQEEFDAVVIVRGGGSTTDLNCFNAYRLSSHVAQFPLPVLTGIGHDKDQSVVDMVAHLPLKTPTAVAGWLIERMSSIEGWLEGAAQQLHDITTTRMREAELRLEQQLGDVRRLTMERTIQEKLRLEAAERLLPERIETLLRFEQQRLER
ncbi:MAG: exodeoxyribonuclease VII large subunit, partial [Alistipes sp.]|nr:exodeoxyribonuclease VII large subunit [Alistipes sp.]